MPNFPQSGVQLVAQDSDVFIDALGRAHDATGKFIRIAESGAGDVARFGDAADGAGGRVGAFGESAISAGGHFSVFGEIIKGALREVGALATQAMAEAGRAIAGFVSGSISVAGDFQQTMDVLGETSGATADEMEQIRQKAIALGNDLTLPTTSASEAGEAMLELSRAGLSVEDAMAAAQGALQLAAAAETDAATASQVVAGALNAFKLEGDQAVRVADLLAAAANASSASMTDLSQGLQQGAFAFEANNQNVDDLVASLAILTNVGLTGSDAGTALKNAIMKLAAPTQQGAALMKDLGINVFDAQGKMLPMEQIIGVLNGSLAGMTDEERNAALNTIFLSDGMKAMIPLLDQGPEGFLKMKDAVNKEGAAASLAAAQNAGFKGALAGLQSQMETLQLIIGTALLPVLTNLLTNVISPAAAVFTDLATAVFGNQEAFDTLYVKLAELFGGDMAGMIVGFIAAIREGDLAGAFMGLAEDAGQAAIDAAPTILASLGEWTLSFLQWMNELRTQLITSLVEALPGIIEGLGVWTQAFTIWAVENIPTIIASFGQSLSQIGTAVVEALPGIVTALVGFIPVLTDSAAQIGTAIIEGIVGPMPGLEGALSSALGGIGSIISGILSGVLGFFEQYGGQIITTAQTTFQSVVQTVSSILVGILQVVTSILTSISQFWQQHGQQIMQSAMQTFGAVSGFIQQVMPGIQAVVGAVLGQIQTFWANNGQQIMASVQQAWTTINSIIQGVLNILGPLVSTVLGGIASFITSHGATIQALFTNTWTIISTAVNAALTLINGFIQAALALMQGDTEGALTALQTAYETAWAAVQTIVTTALDSIGRALGLAWEAIKEIAVSIGGDTMAGILKGLEQGAQAIVDYIVSVGQSALDAIKAFFGITSPSTVFADQVGEPIALGIAEGIAAQTDAVIAAGTSVAQSLLDAMETMDEEAKKQAEETADAILTELERLAEKSAALMERIIGDVLSGSAGLARGGARASSLFGSLYPDSGDIAKAEKAIKDAQKRIGDLSAPTARKKSSAAEDLAGIAAERTLLEWTARNNDSLEKREQARQKLLDLNKKEANLRDKIAEEEADYQVKEQARLGKLKEAQDALTLAQGQQAEAQQEYAEQAEIAGKARDDLAQAQAEAQELAKTDPKVAADFLDLRVRQIGELAKLEQQAAAAATSDEAERYRTQIALVRQAQQFETATFQQNAAKRAADMAAFAADAQTTGNAMIDGMVAGIRQSAGTLEQAMVDAVSRALEGVRRQFGITSPSLVWAEQVGVPLMEGVGAGIFAALPSVEATIGRAMGQLTGTARVQPAAAATYNQQSYVANNGGNTININGTSMSQSQLVSLVAKAMDGAGAKADIRGRTGSR